MRIYAQAALFALLAVPAGAHRLDEYLIATLLSVGQNQLQAQVTLTPGVAVLPSILGAIDADGDGILSAAEQRAYAERVLNDLSLRLDGKVLAPHLRSARFPDVADMKVGRGEIQLEITAALPPGYGRRTLMLENRHQLAIAAYQVNSLVPSEHGIQIATQTRSYTQSKYTLEYTQTSVDTAGPGNSVLAVGYLGAAAAFLLGRFARVRSRRRTS